MELLSNKHLRPDIILKVKLYRHAKFVCRCIASIITYEIVLGFPCIAAKSKDPILHLHNALGECTIREF